MSNVLKLKTSFLLLIIVSASLISVAWFMQNTKKSSQVLAVEDNITVSALVYGCQLDITTYPEKRIPRTGNWDTLLSVRLVNTTTNSSIELQTPTDTQGRAVIDLCERGFYLETGVYNFYLTGYSHLRKLFPNQSAFTTAGTVLTFTATSQFLLAGETSVIFDNKINSLDISTQVNNLYTGNVKNDLNQDGEVNSLDLANTIVNLYMIGD